MHHGMRATTSTGFIACVMAFTLSGALAAEPSPLRAPKVAPSGAAGATAGAGPAAADADAKAKGQALLTKAVDGARRGRRARRAH